MPNIQSITVSFSKKKQIEQYEPIECGVSITVSLTGDEKPEEVAKDIRVMAKDIVREDIMAHYREKREKEKAAELKKFIPRGTSFDPVSEAITQTKEEKPPSPSAEALAFAMDMTPEKKSDKNGYTSKKKKK